MSGEKNGKIWVIDDDTDLCLLLNKFLVRNGHEAEVFYSGKKALDQLQHAAPDLVICDFRLNDITGAEFLKSALELHPGLPVMILTGYSDVKNAVQIMKAGAFDYITKPVVPEELLLLIQKALDSSKTEVHLVAHTTKQKHEQETVDWYLAGASERYRKIMRQIDLVAPTNLSVIIYGESGSGKEAIARKIHEQSQRSKKPFVAIDCGALTKEISGSELFGHEKGAFTGATVQKMGSLETADGGTVFLDEIGNLPYEIQVSLLRVVQERKIRRVGGVKDIHLDIRIIVASNEPLKQLTGQGKFREDLYHRFNEFSIDVPPLRDRGEDIAIFALAFLKQANAELGKHVQGFDIEVLRIFEQYKWPGNLRELKNTIRRAALLCDRPQIGVEHLQNELLSVDSLKSTGINQFSAPAIGKQALKNANIDAEYQVILDALAKVNYNKSEAAKLLGVDRKTIYNKLRQFENIKK